MLSTLRTLLIDKFNTFDSCVQVCVPLTHNHTPQLLHHSIHHRSPKLLCDEKRINIHYIILTNQIKTCIIIRNLTT